MRNSKYLIVLLASLALSFCGCKKAEKTTVQVPSDTKNKQCLETCGKLSGDDFKLCMDKCGSEAKASPQETVQNVVKKLNLRNYDFKNIQFTDKENINYIVRNGI